MNKDTFQSGQLYRITKYGKINTGFPNTGNKPVTLAGKGEHVWFVGLVWRRKYTPSDHTRFFLVASNYFDKSVQQMHVTYNESRYFKRDRVKTIELFTLKELPLLIGTKTTTLLYDHLLKNGMEKIEMVLAGNISL